MDALNETTIDRSLLEKRHNSGSGWFGTIAVLSLINIIITFADLQITFPVGLGMSSFGVGFLTYKEDGDNSVVHIIGGILMVISIIVIVCLWVCRTQARMNKTWPYVLGLCIYSFDAALTIFFDDWISFAFHAWGIYSVWVGYSACKAIIKLNSIDSVVLTEINSEGVAGES